MSIETPICDACGEGCHDGNFVEHLLTPAGVDTMDEVLCEGCAEDVLDATRSAMEDDRETGRFHHDGHDDPMLDADVIEDAIEVDEPDLLPVWLQGRVGSHHVAGGAK